MNKTVGIAAALLVAGGVFAAYFWLQLRDERQRGSELVARVEALEAAGPVAASAAMPAVETPAAAPSTAPAPAAPPQAAAQPAQAPRNAAADGDKSPIAAMLGAMQSPGGREAMIAMMRGAMAQLYPDVEQELGLTSEEKEKLFDSIVRHEEGMSTEALAMLSGDGGDPAAARELQRKLAEREAAHERELTALLGSKYPKWQEYKSESEARAQLGQLRPVLAASGNPLSETQEKALVKAFAAEMARSEKEEREWMITAADSPDMMQESMKRAAKMQRNLLELAKPHLNDAQLAQYRRQVEQQEKMLQSMMGMFGGTGNRPMNRLFAGLAMALLVVAVVAVHLWLEVGKQRESNAALAARIGALESARSGAVAQEAVAQDAALTVPSGGVAAVAPAPAGAGNARAAAAGGEAALMAGMREMLESESGRELIASFGVMALRQQYPDLEKAMGLTPEEADKLLELLARQRVDRGLPPGVRRSRPDADPAARERQERALAEQRERERAGEEEIAALLGDRYPKWQEYERTSAERMRETYTREGQARLREAVSSRDSLMSDATFEAFNAAVDAEERRFQQESPPRSVQQQVQQMPEMHRRMIQAASAHLDAVQLERYRKYLAEQVNMMSGAMLMIDDE